MPSSYQRRCSEWSAGGKRARGPRTFSRVSLVFLSSLFSEAGFLPIADQSSIDCSASFVGDTAHVGSVLDEIILTAFKGDPLRSGGAFAISRIPQRVAWACIAVVRYGIGVEIGGIINKNSLIGRY